LELAGNDRYRRGLNSGGGAVEASETGSGGAASAAASSKQQQPQLPISSRALRRHHQAFEVHRPPALAINYVKLFSSLPGLRLIILLSLTTTAKSSATMTKVGFKFNYSPTALQVAFQVIIERLQILQQKLPLTLAALGHVPSK
jgi:hypothetical protein